MKLKPRQRKLFINILAIAIPILSIVAIYFGLQIALATDRPFVAVATGSMRPSLEIGDLLIIQGIPPTNIQPGDIIVFDTPGTNRTDQTIHRVVRTQTLLNGTIQFKTKGDDNKDEDPYWVPENNVRGHVVYQIPYLGYLVLDPTITITIVIIVVIIILIWPEKKSRFRRHKRTSNR